MAEIMSKAALVNTLEVERARWNELLDQISPAWMLLPGAAGRWSVKDVIGHVTWYEREIVTLLREHALTASALWDLPPAERNQVIFDQNRLVSLDTILAEHEVAHQELLRALKSISDEDLNDPSAFLGMPDTWVPWEILAQNTYTHYRDHMPGIRAWLENS